MGHALDLQRLVFPSAAQGAPVSIALIEALIAHPYGLTADELLWEVWRGTKYTPASYDGVSVRVCHINKAFKKNRVGLRIRGNGGPGSKYLLYVVREK